MVASIQQPATRVSDLVYVAIAALAGGFAIVQSGGAWIEIVAVLVALAPWALVGIRREPPMWIFAALALLPIAVIDVVSGEGVALFMAVGSISWIASRSDSRLLIAVSALIATGLDFLPWVHRPPDPGAFYFGFGNVVAVVCGLLLRRATRLAAELQVANGLLARASADEERRRIARDVHDLVAHSLTIVVLHIGGARRTLRRDPDTAELALVEAERVARDSLDGIRRIVGLLRDESDEPGAASLDLEELVASYGRAGLDTSFTQRGTLDDAPLLVRVALRRVLQEALANASQHAAPRSVVEVTVGADAVAADLHVVNAVDDPHRASHGGYGLVGLREQISHLGGELAAGARDGRWRVDCRIPYSVVEQA